MDHLNTSSAASIHQHMMNSDVTLSHVQHQPQAPQHQAAQQPVAAGAGIPLWLKRLRRIDRSLSAAIEASSLARQQAALGLDSGLDDDLFSFDVAGAAFVGNDGASRGGSAATATRTLPLVSPHIFSSPQQRDGGGDAAADVHSTAAADASGVPADVAPVPARPVVVNLSGGNGARHNESGHVDITFPSKHGNNHTGAVRIPVAAVSSCVICRATPREVSVLEEEVARLRAFVAVQRESFQMQLDDVREAHAAEMKDAREGAQAELNERLVAYMREVDDLRKHLAMAEGVVVQFAKLKDQHADLSKRYEMLLGAATASGGGGGIALTPADQRIRSVSESQHQQQTQQPQASSSIKRGGAAAAVTTPDASSSAALGGGGADWELEKMELLAELEHWKRQAVVAGVAAKTAVGAHSLLAAGSAAAVAGREASSGSRGSMSPPVAEPLGAVPAPTAMKKPLHQPSSAATSIATATTSHRSGGNFQRPEPTYTSSLPDAVARLEAWRREVNPGHATRMQQQQPQGRSSVSAARPGGIDEVSPSTAVQTPQHQRRSAPNDANANANTRLPVDAGGSTSSVRSAGSLFTGASSSDAGVGGAGIESERQRWTQLMQNIVGSRK